MCMQIYIYIPCMYYMYICYMSYFINKTNLQMTLLCITTFRCSIVFQQVQVPNQPIHLFTYPPPEDGKPSGYCSRLGKPAIRFRQVAVRPQSPVPGLGKKLGLWGEMPSQVGGMMQGGIKESLLYNYVYI